MIKIEIEKTLNGNICTKFVCPVCKHEGEYWYVPTVWCTSCKTVFPPLEELKKSQQERLSYHIRI